MLVTSSVHAQAIRQASGTVKDSSGAVVISAEVTLQDRKGRTLKRTATDPTGTFRLPLNSNSDSVVVVRSPGFQVRFIPSGVFDQRGDHLYITLEVAADEETIAVDASDSSPRVSTDRGRNQNGEEFESNALDRLPVFDANYVATLSRFLDPDATGTNGVTLVVNGIEANGPGVTASAITSVKINQNPYSALFSRPGRARIELTTEGGTPQMHGQINFLTRDAVFDARNPFALIKPDESRQYLEGSLTGPLTHDKKNTFLLSAQWDTDNPQAIVVAATPSGIVNQNVPNPTDHTFLAARAFLDFSPGNQVWASYSYERQTVHNAGVGGTVLPEAGSSSRDYENAINVGSSLVLSPRWLNQLRALVGQNKTSVVSNTAVAQITVPGSFTGGGAQLDALRTEFHFDGADILTYSTGRQTILFGIDVPDISRRGRDDDTNQLGTYTFAGLAQYAAQQPFSYLVQQGQPHVAFVEKTVAGIFEDTVRVSPQLTVGAGVRYYWQNYFHDIAHNVAPRFDFAFAPRPKGRTVIRGGAGFFFDRTGPSPISDLLHFDGSLLRRYLDLSPTYPEQPLRLASIPTSLITLDPRARIPYTVQFGAGVEHQLTAESSLAINYVGSRGIDLFRSVDANAPLPPTFATRPNTLLGQDRQIQSEGYAKINSLEITFRGQLTPSLTGQMQYDLAKSYNNTSGITWFPANSYAPGADWGRSDNARRHRLNLLGTYQAHDWIALGTALSVYSGAPVNVTTGGDANNDGLALDRPGNEPRNLLHGPGYLDLDFNLSHDFFFRRDKKTGPKTTLAVGSFNVLNHTNDLPYIGVLNSSFFGTAVAAQPARRMQFNLSIAF